MPASLSPASLSTLRVSSHTIPAHGLTPNSTALNKPLLIYHSAFPATQGSVSASAIESHLKGTGVVTPQWRYTMYTTSHFHSTSHEVLCISNGRAKLCFGGEENEGRVEPTVDAGDVIIVPAGVAHRLLEDLSDSGGSFEMVGSYPRGFNWDMCYGKQGEEKKIEGIKQLAWFDRDPIYGDKGPVLDA